MFVLPSKNIYNAENSKIIKNKIKKVNYSYDDMVVDEKETSFNIDIWNANDGLNSSLKTVTNNKMVYVETTVTIDGFGLFLTDLYVFYPNVTWIDRNGKEQYGMSYRKDTVYYKVIPRKLTNDDDLFDGGDFRLLVYFEESTKTKIKMVCYVYAGLSGDSMYSGYHTNATINASFLDYIKKEVSVDNNSWFSLPKNELMQENSYKGESMYVLDFIASTIISHYKEGKETAVIRCSIPEDLSVFEIGDEVIPMVYGADGVDRPMSRYKNGTQKVFNVVGTKFIYDGAVWQELTLQEKTQSV